MQLKFPKPLHGWRAFAGEVGVIVLGVLIALAAQQMVEEISWRKNVHDANAWMRDEIYSNAGNMAERRAIQPCLRGQISKLAHQLDAGGDRWIGLPVGVSPTELQRVNAISLVLKPAYRPPHRLWLDDQWKAASADGTLAHFPAKEATDLSAVYQSVRTLEQLQEAEAAAATRLAYLASDRVLTGEDRLRMYEALAEVDRVNTSMATISDQQLKHIARMHLGFDKRELDKDSREMTRYLQDLRGNCVLPVQLSLN